MQTILSYADFSKQWNSAADIEDVVKDLNTNENSIEVLQLNGNSLGIEAAEHLTHPLSFQSKLKKLLWNDLFTGRLKSEIAVALKSLSLGLIKAEVRLVELDLRDNAFGPNGVVGVTDLLASPCCYTLKKLNMNNQGLGHQGCRYLIDALKKSRKDSNKLGMNLEVFIAGRNRLENAGMKMLAEFFGDGMSSLKELVLLQNGIGLTGVEGIKDLILSIQNHENLKILNLSDNIVKANGMKELCKVLPYFEQLEEVYLDDCLLKNGGLSLLTQSLPEMSDNLKTISVIGNEITCKSAIMFVEKVTHTKTLIEKVNLNENEIGKRKMMKLKEIMEEYDKGSAFVIEENEDEDEEEEDDEDEEEDEEEEEESSEGVNEESEDSDSVYQESVSNDNAEDDSESEAITAPSESNHTVSITYQPLVSSVSHGNGILENGNPPISNLFNSTKPNGDAKFNLFRPQNPETQRNLFKQNSPFTKTTKNTDVKNLFGTSNATHFSFLSAANINPDSLKKLKEYISTNINCKSIIQVQPFDLTIDSFVESNKVIDLPINQAAESNPETAVRVGLILSNRTETFDIGLSLIKQILTSGTAWSRATNAILVEMGFIKSEEKNFSPVCCDISQPIKVLEKILDTESTLSDEVRSNLSCVLKNLNKKSMSETENLLKKLEICIGDLKI